MRYGRLAVLLCASTLAGGCSIRTGDLTVIATKNIPSFKGDVRGTFEGRDCRAFTPPNLEEAIDDAIEKGGGNAMTDTTLYFQPGFFRACFRAKGTVVQLRPQE